MTPQYHVTNLRSDHASPATGVLAIDGSGHAKSVDHGDLSRVFQSPWREIALVRLNEGGRLGPRELSDSEVMLYVTTGTGTAWLHDGPVELREGIAVTLFRGELLDITADSGLEFFFAEISGGQ